MPATNNVFESDNIIPAAYAALDEINANCSILGDYTLQIDFVNTLVCAYVQFVVVVVVVVCCCLYVCM